MDGIDIAGLFKMIAALAFVVGLMFTLAYILKKLGLAQTHIKGKNARLKVVETTAIDSRHRAVLLQRDDVQHLVICGPSGETVVETGIKPVQGEGDEA